MTIAILFSYIAVHPQVFLVRISAHNRSAETVLHSIILLASPDSQDRIPASRVGIGSFRSGAVIVGEIDSLFPDIARYLLGDIPDIFLNHPHDLQSFIDLNNIAVDRENREHNHRENSDRNHQFYESKSATRGEGIIVGGQ